MEKPYQVTDDISIFQSWEEAPTLGFLSINAYVIKAKELAVVDAGMWIEKKEYMQALESVVDPKEIKWIFLTHDDNDHKGSLPELLEIAPNARLVCQFIAVGRMMDTFRVPLDRLHLVNPGDSVDIGDRKITVLRPPLWDAPPTVAYYDDKSGALFCADSFGAFIPAKCQDADDIPAAERSRAQTTFASIVSPWVHMLDEAKFAAHLKVVRDMDPKLILGCHLPPAKNHKADEFLKALTACPPTEPWCGPNQAAMEAMMAQMAHGGPPQG